MRVVQIFLRRGIPQMYPFDLNLKVEQDENNLIELEKWTPIAAWQILGVPLPD